MNHIQLLDVTLRDGGYRNHFSFSEDNTKIILTHLEHAKIDYVEVGYRNGSFKSIPNIGASGLCEANYLNFCKKYLINSKMTVMVHPKNVTYKDMEDMYRSGVDAVRICFPIHNPEMGFKTIEMAQDLKFDVFVNFTRISQYSHEELMNFFNAVKLFDIKAVYFADSNGSLLPREVSALFHRIGSRKLVQLGFHAHDNLQLAQANALAAIDAGASFIDVSLAGMGKGAGNLKTEFLVAYMHAEHYEKYDLPELMQAAEKIKATYLLNDNKIHFKEIVMGVCDLSQDENFLFEKHMSFSQCYKAAKQYIMDLHLKTA